MKTVFEKSKAEKEKDLLIEEIETNTESIKNNSKKELERAKKNLSKCKELVKDQMQKGYTWITNGKITKLVSPCKLQDYLSNGFKKLKRK